MEILEAYDLTGSFRQAAALVGCDRKTVAHGIWVREPTGGAPPARARHRRPVADPFAAKIDALVERSPRAIMSIGLVIVMPLTFASNVFVEPTTMPSWLHTFVDLNPISHLVSAERGLLNDTATTGQIVWVLMASAALTALFAPLTMHLYRNRGQADSYQLACSGSVRPGVRGPRDRRRAVTEMSFAKKSALMPRRSRRRARERSAWLNITRGTAPSARLSHCSSTSGVARLQSTNRSCA